jgi:hypothetical protein
VIERIEALIREIETTADPATVERARALVEGVLSLHRAALERALGIAREGPGGAAVVEALARDDLVSGLLLLHDLHPRALEERVREAVGRIPAAEVVSVREGAVRVVVPRAALREAVAEVLEAAAPDAASIEIEAPPEGFVPIARLGALKP